VIELCNEAAKSTEQIRVAVAGEVPCGDDEMASVLNELTVRRVLYEERGKYFTLAIPENPYL
jgi:hypothetical protein